MKCYSCQSENRYGVKFCEECGVHIAVVCPRCDSRIPVGKKFCGECGQKLSASKTDAQRDTLDYSQPNSYTPKFMAEKILTTRGSLEGERKLVTVFFCDVTGFTSLSENQDPEAVHQIMDGCFKILMEEIHQFEGTINQFTGDGVMALFGAPIAHEDHAQRACYAAIAVQKALARYAASVKKDFGVNFKMRIGLNSGPVVVGAIGDDLRMDYTAVGDTTNLAARMESHAEPGTILISENTYRLVNKYFQLKSLGKIPMKGKTDPQAVYRLIDTSSVHSRLDASKARGLVNYIGRRDQLKELQKTIEKVAAGHGQVVGVVGEAGIGKSRFVYETHHRTDTHCRFIQSRCLQYSSNIPFHPLLECIQDYFDIDRGALEDEANKKLTDGLTALDEDLLTVVSAFRDFLSLPVRDTDWESLDPKEKRTRTFEALRNFFIRLSQDSPVIFVIDDIQWIDRTSEEFLNYFIEWIPNSHILLLLLYRQEYKHSWASKSFYKQIGIGPLSASESRQFIRSLLKDVKISQQVEALLAEKTSGNPLFMEELTFALLEDETIVKEDHVYQLKGNRSSIHVPDSIQGIVAGRMDRLEDNIKSTMQTASVIGRNFIFRLVEALTGMGDEIKGPLLELQRLELIYEKRLFPELEYTFKNAVTQEVAYNSLLIHRRRQLHEKTGKIIEAMFPKQLEEFYEILAHHFSKSDNHDKAVQFLKLSGDKALRNNSAWEAYEFYKTALHIMNRYLTDNEHKKEKLNLLHAMMSPIILLNFPEESLEIITSGAALSKELSDKKSLIRFYSNIGFFHSVKGRLQEGARYSQKAFDQATQINDLTAMAQASPDLCLSSFAAAKYNKVISIASTMIHAIHKAGREKDNFGGPAVIYPTFYSFSGLSLAHLGKFEESMSNGMYALEEARDSSNLFTLSICHYYPGFSLLLKGDFKGAQSFLKSCLEVLEKVDFVQIESLAKCGLGVARAFSNEPQPGIKLAKEGLENYQKAGIKWQVSMLQYYTGMCYHQLADLKTAALYFDRAVETAMENAEPFHQGKAMIWKGFTQGKMSLDAIEKAISITHQGVQILTGLGTRPDIAVGKLFLGELYHDADREKDAQVFLKEAAALFERMDMKYWSSRAGKLLNPGIS